MLKMVAIKENASEKPVLVLGITARDYANFLAGEVLKVDPGQLGLPFATFTIFVLGGTTEEQIVARVTGGVTEVPVSTEAEMAEFVKENTGGKITH